MATETKSRKGIGGPKTKEGKEKVRLNALKTGLHAVSIEGMQAVSDVIEVQFDDIHEQMRDYYRPQDFLEETLVHRIARCTWRLRVIETIEDYKLTRLKLDSAPGSYLPELSVIERRTDVQLHRAIQALAAKRKQDRENMKNKLNELPPPGRWPRPEPETEGREAPEQHNTQPEQAHEHDACTPMHDSGHSERTQPPNTNNP